jgi:hypothetical protein
MPTDNPRLCGSNLAARYWLASSFKPPRPLNAGVSGAYVTGWPSFRCRLAYRRSIPSDVIQLRRMSPRLSGSVKRIVPEKRADFDRELMSVMRDRRRYATDRWEANGAVHRRRSGEAHTHLAAICSPQASASMRPRFTSSKVSGLATVRAPLGPEGR